MTGSGPEGKDMNAGGPGPPREPGGDGGGPGRRGAARAPALGRISALFLPLVAGLLVVAAASAGWAALQEAGFPHEEHAGLFPVCTGCHEAAGGAEPGYPEPGLCANCHDGADLPSVRWTGPVGAPDNVSFDHRAHAAMLEATGEASQGCEDCHSTSAEQRMRVEDRVAEAGCFACHQGTADEHFAGAAPCATCHVPLADAEFSAAHIAALPVPADHESGTFLEEAHGAAASAQASRCATCHTVERCLTCHVDTGNPVFDRIPAARTGQELPRAVAAYPVPESHRTDAWLDDHGASAEVGTCNTCHTTNDCRACHVGSVPQVVEALPARSEVSAPGVGLRPTPPESHRSPFFLEAHETLAAADGTDCATCHTESYCVACHDAPAGGSYHPPDFVASHSAAAFGREDECATCHQTASFCRSCHVEAGLGSTGRLDAGYHDAEPLWLLRHGGAARQNLESCASCHQQTDCVQCHGVLGSFRVSPHRPGFDAEAAWATSPATCLACHVGNPLGGGGSR